MIMMLHIICCFRTWKNHSSSCSFDGPANGCKTDMAKCVPYSFDHGLSMHYYLIKHYKLVFFFQGHFEVKRQAGFYSYFGLCMVQDMMFAF
jgi:hypothetical protein